MNETEIRDAIYSEVRRQFSPWVQNLLVALNIVLVIGCLVLYDQGRNNKAWIDVLSGDVKALKSANHLASEISQLRSVLESVAAHLEVQPKELTEGEE